jgi:hypothetical protein
MYGFPPSRIRTETLLEPTNSEVLFLGVLASCGRIAAITSMLAAGE